MRYRQSGANGHLGRVLGWAFAVAAMSRVESAAAQSSVVLPNLRLDWPNVAGCPSRDEVRLAIAHHLGSATARSNVVRATATIEDGAEYRLVLHTQSSAGTGTRALRGDTCRSVADAAVVVLAILLGEDGSQQPLVRPERRASRVE